MKTFPKPLTAKEEKECLERCRKGDTSARDELIEKNLRLVAYIVKKYAGIGKDSEDLISIGTIGLIKAIDSFDVDKGIRLATYASRCIDNELLMLLRSEKKQAKEVYLNESIGSDKEGNEISLIDIIETSDEDVTDKVLLKEDLGKLYDYVETVLSDREKNIIYLRYGIPDGSKEYTQREIADIMGISRSYISRIEKKALNKLKKAYDEN
ncbi:MAG: RNA polymerase sporulation sigma factor SigK [Lachnospiraceae bacterium]